MCRLTERLPWVLAGCALVIKAIAIGILVVQPDYQARAVRVIALGDRIAFRGALYLVSLVFGSSCFPSPAEANILMALDLMMTTVEAWAVGAVLRAILPANRSFGCGVATKPRVRRAV